MASKTLIRSYAVAKRLRDASCMYRPSYNSFNTKRRAQSFIISVSASGIPLRTIKFFLAERNYVMFG